MKSFLSIPKGDSLSTGCDVKTFSFLGESSIFVFSYSISSSFTESGTIFGQFTHGSNIQFGPCHHRFSSHIVSIDTPLVAMSAGLSFVFTYWNFAFVCPLISFTLFSINTGSIFVLEIQCNTHCESVIKKTVSNGSLSCVSTYFKHLTPISTARNSSLGIVIFFYWSNSASLTLFHSMTFATSRLLLHKLFLKRH